MKRSPLEHLMQLQRKIAELSNPGLAEQFAQVVSARASSSAMHMASKLATLEHELSQLADAPGAAEFHAVVAMLASNNSVAAEQARIWNRMQALVRRYTLLHLALGSPTSDITLLARKDDTLRKILRMLRDTRSEPTLQPLTTLLQQVVAMEQSEGGAQAAEELLAGLNSAITKVLDELKARVPVPFDRLVAIIALIIGFISLYYTMITPQWAVNQSHKLDIWTANQTKQQEELRHFREVLERVAEGTTARNDQLTEIEKRLSRVEAALVNQLESMHELATRARVHTRRTGSSGLVAVLDRGMVVQVLEEHGKWSRVRAAATTGHIIEGWIPTRALRHGSKR